MVVSFPQYQKKTWNTWDAPKQPQNNSANPANRLKDK